MGGFRSTLAARPREHRRLQRATAPVALMLVGALAAGVTACDEAAAEPGVVEQADVYTALVSWQAAEQEPIVNDAGETQLPVIYLVDANGGTIDVGVQATVTEATADTAVVRFADEAADSFDADAEGSPVHDNGVMLSIGAVTDPARTVTVDVDRFTAEDEYELLSVAVTASEASTGDSTDPPPPTAAVTVTTQR